LGKSFLQIRDITNAISGTVFVVIALVKRLRAVPCVSGTIERTINASHAFGR
jgi:hypothetical protein